MVKFMDENPNEIQETILPDAPPVTEEPEVETPQVDERLKKLEEENVILKQKNERLFARTKQAEEKARPSGDIDFLEVAKVAKKYSDEELELIHSFAKKTGLTLGQAEKDEVVQLALQAQKTKVANEKVIPVPMGGSGSDNSELEKAGQFEITDGQFKKAMSSNEHKKLWEEFQKKSGTTEI